jgi:hypothetical protein
MMFRDEECLLVSFLETVREGAPTPEEGIPLIQEGIERGGLILHREEAEVPDWIKGRTPEELAVEILEFTKKEKTEQGLDYDSASRCFWESKGVNEFLMPSEVQLNIRRADFLARRQALQEEKDELPSLVGKCVDWARINNLNKVAVADVDAFLLEKDLHLLRETKRALYSIANLKLKSKK